MNMKTKTSAWATALLALTFVGCSDSDNSAPAVIAPPPTTTDVVSVGAIAGFGSVIVNGVEYNTDTATVSVDDAPGVLSDLRVGMVVSVHGTVNDSSGAASASNICFVDDAEGMITSIDRINNSFVVLGRTVFVDELTVFDNATFSTLTVGNVVEVSGLWRSQERIQARHVERKADAYTAGMEMEVKGEINGLDTANRRFNIGTQMCDYSAAMLELGDATLANGLYVEVSSSAALSNGDLILDRIEARDRDRDRDRLCESDCDFELVGYVTRFVSPTDFDVDGYPVSTTDTTAFVNGTVDDVALDAKVAVEGTLDANDVLVADTVVFRLASLIQIEADVESIDATAGSFSLLGVTIMSNESTVYRDDSDIDIREFGLDDVAVGDRLEIRAYLDGDTVMATRVERDDADDSVTLKALVEATAQPNLTLLGVTVVSDANTEFENQAHESVDASTFFALLTTGNIVKAEGFYDGASLLASELYLRDCDNDCF